MTTLRKPLAVLCIAVVVLTAMLAGGVALALPLVIVVSAVVFGGGARRFRPTRGDDSLPPALAALSSSGHLARASLLPAAR